MALSLLERTAELKLWLSPDYEPVFRGTWLAMKESKDSGRTRQKGAKQEDFRVSRTSVLLMKCTLLSMTTDIQADVLPLFQPEG